VHPHDIASGDGHLAAAEPHQWQTEPIGEMVTQSRPAQPAAKERTSPVTFYRQVVAELRKVVWPTQQQLVTYFIVVIVFVLALIAYVSGLDVLFGKAVFWLFGK